MPIEFDGCNISENKIGVRTPADADLKFKNTDIVKNEVGVDIYISKEMADKLQLPEDTPQEYLDEVEKLLKENAEKDEKSKLELLENSRLFKWLGHASSVATLATTLIVMF